MHNKILKEIDECLDRLERDGNSRAVYDSAEQKLRRILKELREWEYYKRRR